MRHARSGSVSTRCAAGTARAGSRRAAIASNRRIVSAKEIERLRGAARGEHQVSARNRFSGTVREVKVEGLMAQVEVVVTEPAVLTAIVTADSVKDLGIKRGNHVVAVIKATSVMVER